MLEQEVKRLKLALNLQREVAGAAFLRTQAEFDAEESALFSGRRTVCGMVRRAEEGERFKVLGDAIACRAGAVTLGVLPPAPAERDGRVLEASGLCRDGAVARAVKAGMCDRPPSVGLAFGPLAAMRRADVAVLVVSARQAMRLMQGYAYHYGPPMHLNTVGNQAVCSDLIAKPCACQDLNCSFLCRGARANLRAEDGELGIGIPTAQFQKVVDGVIQTLSLVESEQEKEAIAARLDHPLELGREIEKNTSCMKRMDEALRELG